MRTLVASLIVLVAAAAPASAQDVKRDTLPLRATTRAVKPPFQAGLFSHDSRLFVASAGGGLIHVWNVADGKLLHTLEGQPGPILGLAVTKDKRLISAGGRAGSLALWDLSEGKKIADLPGPPHPVFALAVSSDGKHLALGGGGPTANLRLWDLERRQEIASLSGHSRFHRALVFSPDDRLLAAAEDQGELTVWDVASRKPLVKLLKQTRPEAVHFSPDGKYLAASNVFGEITVWETASWADEASVKSPLSVNLLRYSSAVNMLISLAPGGEIHLWNPAQLEDQPPLHFAMPKENVWLANLSPDGKTLATGNNDAVVRFWSIPPDVEQRFPSYVAKPKTELVPARVGPARMAIVASEGAAAARNLQDLATVALNAEPGVQLVDRADIERILREQKLSLGGLVDADTAVQAGKLLAADLLGVIEASPQSKSGLGMVVFDAATGVRLVDMVFKRAELEQQAQETAASVRTALAKWRAGVKNLKTVCVLPARNADLPRSLDPFCEALTASLERRLVQQPGLATLERKRLDGVTKEKELAADVSARELLAALLLVEIELARASQGSGIRATVVIRNQGGAALHKFTHETADPDGAGLFGPVLERVEAILQTAKGQATLNRTREARRFLHEAEMLWNHGHRRQGLQAAEAAYALKPDERARLKLAECLSYHALETCKPGALAKNREYKPFPASAEIVQRALGMGRRAHQLVDSAKSRIEPKINYTRISSAAESHESFIAESSLEVDLRNIRVEPPNPDAEREVRDFQAACVRRHVERVREFAERVGRTPEGIERLTEAQITYADKIQMCAADAAMLTKAVQEMLSVWWEHARDLPAEAAPIRRAGMFTDGAEMFATRVLRRVYDAEARFGTYSAPQREASLSLLAALQEHPHPVFQLYASHYHTKQLLKLGRIDARVAEGRHRDDIALAKRWIDRGDLKPAELHRTALYLYLKHVLDEPPVTPTLKRLVEAQFDAVDFALERRDLVGPLWVSAAYRALSVKELYPRTFQLIRRMIEVHVAPPHRVTYDPGKYVGRELERAHSMLLKIAPHLAKEQSASPWDKVTVLADAKSAPGSTILAPTLHERNVFLFTAAFDATTRKPVLQLHRTSLNGGPLVPLGKVEVALKDEEHDSKTPRVHPWRPVSLLGDRLIHRERLYVATPGDGIYDFPLTGGDALRIGDKEGLPSLTVHALAAVDDKLVARLEGGYLAVYDLQTHRCDVVVSSRRIEKLSPFDNSKNAFVGNLLADAPRQRVLFTAVFSGEPEHASNGVWAYSLKDRKFTRLLPMWGVQFSRVKDDAVYLQGYQWTGKSYEIWMARFDLAADKFTLLQGPSPTGISPQSPAGLPKDLTTAFPSLREVYNGGYVWHPYMFRRRPIQGGKEEYLRHVTMPGYAADISFDHLEAVSLNELLLADRHGVYLVRLK